MSEGRELCRTVIPDLITGAEDHPSACHFRDEVAAELLREAAATGIAAHGGQLG